LAVRALILTLISSRRGGGGWAASSWCSSCGFFHLYRLRPNLLALTGDIGWLAIVLAAAILGKIVLLYNRRARERFYGR
jgi:hypothetical protein